MLHILGQNSGKDLEKPLPFLPANANVSDLIAVPETVDGKSSDIVYAATMNSCGGVPNRIWAIDLAPEDKPVTHFDTGASPVGEPALSATVLSLLQLATEPLALVLARHRGA